MEERTHENDGSTTDTPPSEPRSDGSPLGRSRCRFCAIAAGGGTRWPDTVLFASPSYAVVASIGALVPGWVMLVPRKHTLNLVDAFSDSEFLELRLRISARLARAYPSATIRFFEHGARIGNSAAGCGVDHAHLHLVPLEESLVPWCRNDPYPLEWRNLSLSNVSEAVAGHEYLLYSDYAQDVNPKCWMSLPADPVSQFFRRIVAVAKDTPHQYDYRAYPFLTNVAATQATLSDAPAAIDALRANHAHAHSPHVTGWN